MRVISIATDISYDDHFDITTWACYIRYPEGEIKHVSEFKNSQPKTTHAETYALVNAIKIMDRNIPNLKNSRIIVYNEIDNVLRPVRYKYSKEIKESDKHRAEAILGIAKPILSKAKSWTRVKIKAHFEDWERSRHRDGYEMNRWCDKNARRYMKMLRSDKKRLVLK